jgi:hypothetical protein
MDLSKLTDEQVGVALKVIEAAKKHGINPDFVLPMVRVESGFNPNAKSSAGAIGPMQLMPGTAKDLGVDPNDIDQNIDGGIRYLKSLIQNERLKNNPNYIFAAYNAGPNSKFFTTGDFKDLPDETVMHVVKVMGNYGENVPSMVLGEEPAPEEEQPTEEAEETPSEPARDTSSLEAGLALSAIGTGAGSVYAAKAPVFRMAQRVGLLPGGKPISPSDAASLVEKTMSGAAPESVVRRSGHGGENWQRSLTGISTPGAQMDKSSLDLAKRMQGTIGINGAPGFTGGMITEGGIILGPRDAPAARLAQQVQQAQALQREAQFQQSLKKATQPGMFERGAGALLGSTPVRTGLAGFGVGYNAQDAFNRLQEGDTLGASLSAGAAGASGLSVIPKLLPMMAPTAVGLTTAAQVANDLRQGKRQEAAESGLSGLAAVLPRIFGPLGALLYSGGLNAGEDEELKRRRALPPTVTSP